MAQPDWTEPDRRLLALIQSGEKLSHAELAERAGLSKTSLWRRLRDFEASGLIQGTVTLLDPEKLGLNLRVIASVAMSNHADKTRTAFERHVEALPEVTQCYSVSGSWDYELHVLATDMAAYDDFLNRQILNHPSVRAASSSFALRCVKYTTALAVP